MREPTSAPAEERPCRVHRHHGTSTPLRTVRHHIYPLGWGGPEHELNVIQICDNGHYSIHRILDWLRQEDYIIIRGQLSRYLDTNQLMRARPSFGGSRAELALAREGYRRWVVSGRPR